MTGSATTGSVQYGRGGLVGVVALTGVIIGCVTVLIWLAASGRSVFAVFPFSVGAWGSYLCAHYLVEGHFIDESDDDESTDHGSTDEGPHGESSGRFEHLPSSRTHRAFAVLGVGSMVLTFPTGILAVGGDNLTLMLVSATLFVGGYVVGHQGFTGKPY